LTINRPLILISALSIAGVAGLAVYFSTRDSATPAAYQMDDFLALKPMAASTQPPPDAAPQLGSVAEMLEGLKQRLQRDTDDVDGWVLLAKSYYYLDRQAEAREAYDKAVAAGYTGAWKPLPSIDSAMQQIDSPPGTSSEINFEHYLDKGTVEAGNPPLDGQSDGISLRVSLAANLADAFPPETTVYLFARDVDSAGPPLAVVQKKVRDLPLEITLDDSHSMIPGRTISGAERVIVGARISLSGEAIRQDGDIEQLSDPLPAGGEKVVKLNIGADN
jgi:cytochrome c-type biogenesis protein CcmH